MQQVGLVERRQDPHHKTAKPFFITPKGAAYLEASKGRFPDVSSNVDRQQGVFSSDRQSIHNLSQNIGDFLRDLPEFRDSSARRILEVSHDLAQVLSQGRQKQR